MAGVQSLRAKVTVEGLTELDPTETGSFLMHVELDDGTIKAFDMTFDVKGEVARVIYIDDLGHIGEGADPDTYLVIDEKTKDPNLSDLYQDLLDVTTEGTSGTDMAILAAATDLKMLEPELINGAVIRHYTATIDVGVEAAAAAGQHSVDVQSQLLGFRFAGMTELPIDIAIDDQDRVVRVQMHLDTAKGPVSPTVNYSKFNEGPAIVAPDPSKVVQG